MLPLDPDLLIFIKFFIFVTCIIFWIKLGYEALQKSMRMHSHHHLHEMDNRDNRNR